MGSFAVSSVSAKVASERVFAPIALLVAFTTGHGAGLFVRRAKDIVFCTHDIVTGSVEANHNDERR